MAQYIVTVQAQRAGKYWLPSDTFRVSCSNVGVAARKAWIIYKRQPSLFRKRLDNVSFKVTRVNTAGIE